MQEARQKAEAERQQAHAALMEQRAAERREQEVYALTRMDVAWSVVLCWGGRVDGCFFFPFFFFPCFFLPLRFIYTYDCPCKVARLREMTLQREKITASLTL